MTPFEAALADSVLAMTQALEHPGSAGSRVRLREAIRAGVLVLDVGGVDAGGVDPHGAASAVGHAEAKRMAGWTPAPLPIGALESADNARSGKASAAGIKPGPASTAPAVSQADGDGCEIPTDPDVLAQESERA